MHAVWPVVSCRHIGGGAVNVVGCTAEPGMGGAQQFSDAPVPAPKRKSHLTPALPFKAAPRKMGFSTISLWPSASAPSRFSSSPPCSSLFARGDGERERGIPYFVCFKLSLALVSPAMPTQSCPMTTYLAHRSKVGHPAPRNPPPEQILLSALFSFLKCIYGIMMMIPNDDVQ